MLAGSAEMSEGPAAARGAGDGAVSMGAAARGAGDGLSSVLAAKPRATLAAAPMLIHVTSVRTGLSGLAEPLAPAPRVLEKALAVLARFAAKRREAWLGLSSDAESSRR